MRAVGSTGLEVFHDEWYKDSKAPYYHSDEEKNELLRTSDALKGHRTEIASFFSDHEDKNERADFIKTFFDNTFTEMILSNGQRAGYRAFDTLCSLWCLTDSALYQIYGRDTAAGSVVSFYAFMLMSIPMVHFVRNTISGRRRLVPDICIALFCANALAQGAAYRLFGIRFIDMLPLTHLLLAASVAAMLTVLLRSYREQPSQQLRLRIAAFAALGVFGVAALVLYGLLHIYWYDAIFQFGVLLFIILLFRELLGQATEDMRFHMEHRISHQMQREDRMTGLPNRRAFEEYMERIRTGEVGCRDAVLTYIRLEGLNERNDRFGLQAGDEAVIAAARCVADFCRACEDGGESVSCFRTGGNEFALIRPEPRANSGQLHRQFSAIVARYNRTCAPRARITMTYGFSRLCDEDGKSRSISAWKAEADAYLKRNETRLGGDTE